MSKIFSNFGEYKSTAIGLLMAAALLPQNQGVAQLMSLSPAAAKYITLVAGGAAAVLAIFGIKAAKE